MWVSDGYLSLVIGVGIVVLLVVFLFSVIGRDSGVGRVVSCMGVVVVSVMVSNGGIIVSS